MPATLSVQPRTRERLIIGLMSGTSLDGLDVALCRFRGSGLNTAVTLERFATIPYGEDVKRQVRDVFARPQVDLLKLSTLNAWLGRHHGLLVNGCLKKWRVSRARVTAIASHGQTVFHAPAFMHPGNPVNSTLQIGDGDQVAVTTGILTLSDFRQKHIAAGGEGAPLAVYGDYLLLSHKKENRILLNIGGIANFTFLPGGQKANQVWVTDTGPGNTLIDQLVRHFDPSRSFDQDARWAQQGKVNDPLLTALKSHPFFSLPSPKTTGPELFNIEYVTLAQEMSDTESIPQADVLATVTRFSAETIAAAIRVACQRKPFAIYLSGGGAHNPLLVQWIGELLGNIRLPTTAALGIPPDAKEAILFAVLANEALFGKPINYGKPGKIPSVRMGKISLPD